MSDEIYTAATKYTNGFGWVVHPLSPPDDNKSAAGKRPLMSKWSNLTDPLKQSEIAKYFKNKNVNLGLVCGEASDVTIIDIDDELFLSELMAGVDGSDFIMAKRTEGRGHLYFKHCSDGWLRNYEYDYIKIDVRNDNEKGGGGNIVLPPSVHSSGDLYRFNKEFTRDEIPEMPEQFKTNLQKLIAGDAQLSDAAKKSRKWVREFLSSPERLHGRDGRRCMLALCAELKANGFTSDDNGVMISKIVYRDDYDPNVAADQWGYVEAFPWKSDKLISEFPEFCSEKNTKGEIKAKNEFGINDQRPNDVKYADLFEVDAAKNRKLKYIEVSEMLLILHNVISFKGTLYVYDDGVYVDGTDVIKSDIANLAKDIGFNGSITKATNEIMHFMMYDAPKKAYPFNLHDNAIPVKNGVVVIDFDSETFELLPHSHKWGFNYKFDVEYLEQKEDTRRVMHDDVFCKYVGERDINTLYQIPAQAILQMLGSAPFKKAYLLQGEAHAGKSSYLEVLLRMFGEESQSGVSLQQISSDRFALADLEGKVLNVYDDLAGVPINDSGVFKTLTGAHKHRVQRKHMQPYDANISAVQVYTCNVPPMFDDRVAKDTAFWERWEYVNFIGTFDVDPYFYDRIFTEDNLSLLFIDVLKCVVAVRKNGLKINSTASEVREKWSYNADPLYQFIKANLVESERGMKLNKDKLLESYKRWCLSTGVDGAKILQTKTAFTRSIDKYGVLNSKEITVEQGRNHVYVLPYIWNNESAFLFTPLTVKTEQSIL